MNLLEAAKTVFRKNGSNEIRELKTPWSLIPDHSRILPEYPRPQMVRDNYIIHNGDWDYAITNTTLPLEAFTSGHFPETTDGKILVPFSPEAPLSGVNRQLKPGEALWYRHTFPCENIPSGKRMLLHFGAVDERCNVYVNGEPVGNHRGGYLPFSFDITAFLNIGENELLVCCMDDSDSKSEARGKQKLNRGGMFYTAQSGIWQTVWTEWVPDIYIDHVKLIPHPDEDTIKFQIMVRASRLLSDPDELSVLIQIHSADIDSDEKYSHGSDITMSVSGKSIIAKATLSSASFCSFGDKYIENPSKDALFEINGSIEIPKSHRKLWTPETPWLYTYELTLCSSSSEDKITGYFAMRTFTLEKDDQQIPRLCLNHKPYFQNGILDQGYWPDGLLTAPCDEAMIYDIKAMKASGFRMLRKHCKIEPLRWYYHCDRLGMIVWQDMLNGGSDYNMIYVCYLPTILTPMANRPSDRPEPTGRLDEAAKERWMDDMRRTIEHLFNCPAIGSWVLFNEGWGQFDTEKVTELARSLDSTRTIDQASGWFDHHGGDMKSIHNYFRKLTCPRDKTGERALVISEYGGLALPIEGHTRNSDVYGYSILKSQDEFKARFADMMAQIHALEKEGLSAAVYTQVSDIEDEVNGILTYDRQINKLD